MPLRSTPQGITHVETIEPLLSIPTIQPHDVETACTADQGPVHVFKEDDVHF